MHILANLLCPNLYVIVDPFVKQIKERKERNRGAKSEETRSHVSKATSRYDLVFICFIQNEEKLFNRITL